MASLLDISIFNSALQSRIFIIILQVLFNYILPDHDAKVFTPPSVDAPLPGDPYVDLLLSGLRRWDGVYFMHLSRYGYTYENTLAFFPLLPVFTALIGNTILWPLHYVISENNILLIAAVLLNMVAFSVSAVMLFRLGSHVLGDRILAYRAARLYCVNPASIFCVAPYSESLFALLTFAGMLAVECDQMAQTAVCFGAACFTRSNGLVNCGFVFHRAAVRLLRAVAAKWYSGCTLPVISVQILCSILACTLKTSFTLAVCGLPFAAFQWYAYVAYCTRGFVPAKMMRLLNTSVLGDIGVPTLYANLTQQISYKYRHLPAHIVSYGHEQQYNMPSYVSTPEWCHYYLPISYNFVQRTHWDVGAFRYYQLKQLPNFALALPMIILCLCAVVHYVHKCPHVCLTLGLRDVDTTKKNDDNAVLRPSCGLYQRSCFVYLVHMAFLLTFSVIFMHVQVTTRFIASSCPILYWYAASVSFTDPLPRPSDRKDQQASSEPRFDTSSNAGKLLASVSGVDDDAYDITWDDATRAGRYILAYFMVYLFVGVAAFSNFLPWT